MFSASAEQIIILGQGVLLALFLNLVGLGFYLLWEPSTPFYMISAGLLCVSVLLFCGNEEEEPECSTLYEYLEQTLNSD